MTKKNYILKNFITFFIFLQKTHISEKRNIILKISTLLKIINIVGVELVKVLGYFGLKAFEINSPKWVIFSSMK